MTTKRPPAAAPLAPPASGLLAIGLLAIGLLAAACAGLGPGAGAGPSRAGGPGEGGFREAAVAVMAVAEGAEAASFAESLAASLAARLGEAGFEAGRSPEGGAALPAGDDRELARGAFESGARWAAVVRCSVGDRRLLWNIAIYDGLDGALVSADSGGAFAGLSAVAALEESAARAAGKAAGLRGRAPPPSFIEYRLRFSSTDEGAAVAIGSGEGARDAGLVEGGSLAAPYLALAAGQELAVTVSKDGYWPRTLTLRPGLEDEALRLEPLMRKTRHAAAVGLGSGRVAGLFAEYRYHLVEDSVFLRASSHAWAQVSGPGAALHDDLALGAGAYVLLPRASRFRVAVGAGASGIASFLLPETLGTRLYLDACLDPLWLSFEWHEPTWALFVSERVSYSLGAGTGLLRQGWLETGAGPMVLTAGVMLTWP